MLKELITIHMWLAPIKWRKCEQAISVKCSLCEAHLCRSCTEIDKVIFDAISANQGISWFCESSIAQLVECSLSEREVVGSNPAATPPRPHLTKGVKNGTSSSLSDARLKGVVLGR